MNIALDTGEVEIVHHFDRLFFAFDDIVRNMGLAYYPRIIFKKRDLFTFTYFAGKTNHPRLYIAEEEIMNFLDGYHQNTRETTMLLMFDLTQRLEELHELIDS